MLQPLTMQITATIEIVIGIENFTQQIYMMFGLDCK